MVARDGVLLPPYPRFNTQDPRPNTLGRHLVASAGRMLASVRGWRGVGKLRDFRSGGSLMLEPGWEVPKPLTVNDVEGNKLNADQFVDPGFNLPDRHAINEGETRAFQNPGVTLEPTVIVRCHGHAKEQALSTPADLCQCRASPNRLAEDATRHHTTPGSAICLTRSMLLTVFTSAGRVAHKCRGRMCWRSGFGSNSRGMADAVKIETGVS